MKTRWRATRDDQIGPVIRHPDGTRIRVDGGGYAMVTAQRIADLLNADDAAKAAVAEARRAA